MRAADPALTGTLRLLRLFLRRDRIVLPLWVLLLSVPLSTVYVASIDSVYPEPSQRAAFVASVMASPAQRALYGNIYNDSVGATALWKAGVFHALIGLATILTVIRHTRGDEEAGRSELLGSTVVGRYAALAAALMLAVGASILTGLIGAAGLLASGLPVPGSIAFGAALAASGMVFAGGGAVASQLTASARTARGIAASTLGAAFALRALGDAGNGVLSWFSPLGWSLQVRPYAGERWWVLGLHATAVEVLVAAAVVLASRRDLGAGLIAARPGPAAAGAALSGPLGLAWRLQRGALVAWTCGLALYALLAGSIVHEIGDEVAGSARIADILARFGGSAGVEAAFITVTFSFIGVAAAAQAVSATLRLHSEEATGRAETILAGAVSRSRWATSHLLFAVTGPAVTLLVAGGVAGLAYGAAAGDIAGTLPGVLGTAVAQLPSVWLVAAITIALFGALPRFAPAAWAVLVGFVALYLLGSVAGMPQWVLDLSPFSHTPAVFGQPLRPAPLLWLTGLAVTVAASGLAAFGRRDLR